LSPDPSSAAAKSSQKERLKKMVHFKTEQERGVARERHGRARQSNSVEMLRPKQGREVLWLSDPTFPAPIDVHAVAMIADVLSVLPIYLQQDYTMVIAPFTIRVGRWAVIQDASGIRICLLERARVLRTVRLPEATIPA
jgi:hypothetical protein